MTGEQAFLRYQDNGPADYAGVLLTLYMAIGERLYPLLAKAESEKKQLAINAAPADDRIAELTENDVAFI